MSTILSLLSAHWVELLTAILVAAMTSWTTLRVNKIKLKAEISKAAADSYERRHSKMMLAEAMDRNTFREQLISRVTQLEKQRDMVTIALGNANAAARKQFESSEALKRDMSRLVERLNQIEIRPSQLADLHDIPGLNMRLK